MVEWAISFDSYRTFPVALLGQSATTFLVDDFNSDCIGCIVVRSYMEQLA